MLTEIDKTNSWEQIVKRDPMIRMYVEAEMARDGWDRSSNKPGKKIDEFDFDRFMSAMRSVSAQGESK